jgi:prepilin-type N-terminal cleavage/methylation domain-containing protein
MNTIPNRNAFSLLEIIAALVIASTVAVVGIQYLRPSGDTGKQRSCDLTREMLQNDTQRYSEYVGSMPSADLNELAFPQYSGAVLPTCPVTGQAYGLDKDDNVVCPTHESTRLN